MGSAIRLADVTVEYDTRKGARLRVLDSLSLAVEPGSSLAVIGPSGSGKTTILNVLSGLVSPSSGSVLVGDTRVDALSPAEGCDLRRREIGFVFQAFHLLPHLSAIENVAIGAEVRGTTRSAALALAAEALAEVGLAHRQHHRPAELSGGEQQRVALARVLAGRPSLVLADEPTGNLDPAASEMVVQLLARLRDLIDATVVVATHSPLVAALAGARLDLRTQQVMDPDTAPPRSAVTEPMPELPGSAADQPRLRVPDPG